MEKRETLIKGGEMDTEGIGEVFLEKKHTDSGEEKRETKKREQFSLESREKRKHKGKY